MAQIWKTLEDHLVCLVHLALLEYLDYQEYQEPLVETALESQDPLVCPVGLDKMDWLDPLAHRVHLEKMETQGPLDLLEKGVLMVISDFQERLGLKEARENLVFLELLEKWD